MNNARIINIASYQPPLESNFYEHQQFNQFLSEWKYQQKKIVIHQKNETLLIPIFQIAFIESQSNYSKFHLSNGHSILSSKTLKHWENQIDDYRFLRSHQSYLINSNFISKIDSNCEQLWINNKPIPISKSKKGIIRSFLQTISK